MTGLTTMPPRPLFPVFGCAWCAIMTLVSCATHGVHPEPIFLGLLVGVVMVSAVVTTWRISAGNDAVGMVIVGCWIATVILLAICPPMGPRGQGWLVATAVMLLAIWIALGQNNRRGHADTARNMHP
jgi:hypothetical protein